MKLTSSLDQAFSNQVTAELQAATVYLQLAIELENLDFVGMAAWMRIQSDEERVHADKFLSHMLDRDNCPKIGQIEAPKVNVNSPLEAFQAALVSEQGVSAKIRDLYRLANAEDDLDCLPLLQWFLTEQIEEESTVTDIIGRLQLTGDDGGGLLRMDAELGSRPQKAPSSIS